MISSKKSSFPISYGDCPEDDNSRISDKIVDVLKDPECQRYLFSVASALFFLGSQAPSANALPPEAGEFAAAAAAATEQGIPPLGDVIGNANVGAATNAAANAANANIGVHNPLQGVNNIPNQGYNPNMHFIPNQHQPPGKLPVTYRFPGPPITPTGQNINTGFSVAALAFVCLQGYWGNPVFMWGCGGMVLRFLLKMGNVSNL